MLNWLFHILGENPHEDEKAFRERGLQRGDVVNVEKGVEKYYGIWTGEKVIEASYGKIRRVDFKSFARGAKRFAICTFPKAPGGPVEHKLPTPSPFVSCRRPDFPHDHYLKLLLYNCYSGEETARRAEKHVGHILPMSNRQFAIWCKTGLTDTISEDIFSGTIICY